MELAINLRLKRPIETFEGKFILSFMIRFVDFEKMKGLPLVNVVNRVSNLEEAIKGSKKQIKSSISFNDGTIN